MSIARGYKHNKSPALAHICRCRHARDRNVLIITPDGKFRCLLVFAGSLVVLPRDSAGSVPSTEVIRQQQKVCQVDLFVTRSIAMQPVDLVALKVF